jgi:hypothetical protein
MQELHMDQSVKLRLDQGEKTSVKIEIGVRIGCCLSQILFSLCSEYLTNEALEWFGDFRMEEYVICTVKFADNFVLLAKKQMVLLGMIDRLIEIGRFYRMKINLKKLVKVCIWSIALHGSES